MMVLAAFLFGKLLSSFSISWLAFLFGMWLIQFLTRIVLPTPFQPTESKSG